MYKSVFVDSFYHDNSRTEFKVNLAGKAVYNKLVLSSFGYLSAVNTANPAVSSEPDYLGLGGVYNLIDEIELYDGEQLLDQLKSVGSSLWRLYQGNRPDVGQERDEYASGASSIAYVQDDKVYINENHIKTTGLVDLSKLFPLFDSLPQLVDMNLRVVIKYQLDKTKIFKDAANVGLWVVSRPVLCVRELIDDQVVNVLVKASKNYTIEYKALEREQFSVASGKQLITKRLRSAESKKIDKLIIQNYVAANNSFGLSSSDINHANGETEKVQVFFNGRQLLPFSGLDTPARKGAQLLHQADYMFNVYGLDARAMTSGDNNNKAGVFNYGMVQLPVERINTMELQLDCTAYTANMNVLVWSLVYKQLVRANGKWSSLYL